MRIDRFEPLDGHCFLAWLPDSISRGDDIAEPTSSVLDLLEDGRGLGPAHALHNDIVAVGGGRFSHWGRQLYFSASDNSDPRINGREYHVYLPTQRESVLGRASAILQTLAPAIEPSSAYRALEQIAEIICPRIKLGEDFKSFWHDQEFIAAYRYLSGDNYRAFERKFVVYELMRSLDWAPGETAECGTFEGATAYFIAKANALASPARRLLLFDSFEGLSTPLAVDGSHWHAGVLRASEPEVRANLSCFSNIDYFKGWIPSRFVDVADRQFCFVHVDVDLYQPTLDSVQFFYPRLVAGGMLVCDDYGFDTCPGARLAMDNYFADKPDKIIHLPTGQGLVIRRQ